jgi:hypothetical protein
MKREPIHFAIRRQYASGILPGAVPRRILPPWKIIQKISL